MFLQGKLRCLVRNKALRNRSLHSTAICSLRAFHDGNTSFLHRKTCNSISPFHRQAVNFLNLEGRHKKARSPQRSWKRVISYPICFQQLTAAGMRVVARKRRKRIGSRTGSEGGPSIPGGHHQGNWIRHFSNPTPKTLVQMFDENRSRRNRIFIPKRLMLDNQITSFLCRLGRKEKKKKYNVWHYCARRDASNFNEIVLTDAVMTLVFFSLNRNIIINSNAQI